jgi:hypothetical protein
MKIALFGVSALSFGEYDISVKRNASIFRMEEKIKQEISRNRCTSLRLPPTSAGVFLGLLFCPEDGNDVSPKRLLISIGLYGVIIQKTTLKHNVF